MDSDNGSVATQPVVDGPREDEIVDSANAAVFLIIGFNGIIGFGFLDFLELMVSIYWPALLVPGILPFELMVFGVLAETSLNFGSRHFCRHFSPQKAKPIIPIIQNQ